MTGGEEPLRSGQAAGSTAGMRRARVVEGIECIWRSGRRSPGRSYITPSPQRSLDDLDFTIELSRAPARSASAGTVVTRTRRRPADVPTADAVAFLLDLAGAATVPQRPRRPRGAVVPRRRRRSASWPGVAAVLARPRGAGGGACWTNRPGHHLTTEVRRQTRVRRVVGWGARARWCWRRRATPWWGRGGDAWTASFSPLGASASAASFPGTPGAGPQPSWRSAACPA